MGLRGKLYTTGDIADRLGVTRQHAYNLSRRKGFPDPFDEWENGTTLWLTADVEKWIAEKWKPRAEDPETD